MMRLSSIPRLAASVSAALIFFAFCSETCAQSAMTSKNIVYTRSAGVDTMLTSLDVYWKSGWSGKPVMIWVHGGGWRGGDKASPESLPKMRMFNDSGFVFVSINYRLAADFRVNPNDTNIGKIKMRDEARDVALAVAWVRRSIASFGGDPDSIFLMGHSAGAHLVTLISTDGHYAQDAGISTADIKGVVVLDSPVFDLYLLSQEPKNHGTLDQYWTDIAGTTIDEWNNCSPAFFVTTGKTIPPLFLAYTQGSGVDSAVESSMRINQYQSFSGKLTAAGFRNDLHAHLELTHAEINQNFGKPGDKVTAEAMAFLATIRNPGTVGVRNYPCGASMQMGAWRRAAFVNVNRQPVHQPPVDLFGRRMGNGWSSGIFIEKSLR